MQTVFLELVKLSLVGSLFAAAVMLVRLIFPKTPKWIICLLWGVVALRLICPISIESGISLVPERIASGQIIANIGDEYIGDVEIIYENDAAYDTAVEAGRQPIRSDEGYYVIAEKDSLEAPKTVSETLYPILIWIWAAGTVLMLAYTAASYLLLRRKMAEATLLRDNIWQCEQVDSPFVLGFVKPRIYLPYSITDSDMVNVIAHETAHIRRRDHWWKPIGFVLLSIHWFNPILWVAYILLCRDIESACDEKVIRHMEKDEIRAYSTALLNCSVNRRPIAACPLAFGEVGVKERVKTVMNYKKPAFWIVIVAVVLCVVVAVSFLTNPKDYGPEVGNPQMLELPGVAWFATPDEVKEALNISEEQILEEFTTSGYVLQMFVTDLTLFGRDVPYAEFSFWFGDKGDTELQKARLFFSEHTNMNRLKQELMEIYGPGIDEPYRYDVYHDGTDLELSDLEAAARVEEQMDNLEGNPYRDALEDPDYMAHHWVLENGSSIIPAEIVEYLKSSEEEDMPQDEEAFTKKLDQMRWVVISMTNRQTGAIYYDATGKDELYHRLYTNNYIEFNAKLLADYLYDAQLAEPADEVTDSVPLVRGVRYMYRIDEGGYSAYVSGKIIDESKIGERIGEMAVTAGWRNNEEKIWITQESLRAEIYSIDGISKNVAVALKALDEETGKFLYYVLVNPDVDYSEVEKYITYGPVVGISPLTGGTDIYPTVMVEGRRYRWKRVPLEDVPDDGVYYGEVTYVYGNTPTKDCEFMSVFMVSGQIYTIPGNDELVYLRLTTDLSPDWLNEKVVIFALE